MIKVIYLIKENMFWLKKIQINVFMMVFSATMFFKCRYNFYFEINRLYRPRRIAQVVRAGGHMGWVGGGPGIDSWRAQFNFPMD